VGRKDEEPPRQPADKFKANDQVAKVEGGQAAVKPVLPCNYWKLDVNVTGHPNARKPKMPQPTINFLWDDMYRDKFRCAEFSDDKATMGLMTGHGPTKGQCSASAVGWYVEAAKDVTLADGDDKTIDLVMRPHVWIAFELRDHKTNDHVDKIQVKARHASIGDIVGPTLADKALDIEHAELRPGHTLDLDSLEHAEFVWEVVGSVTSA